ncbi:MAG TPA: inorganic phosphate transporter, partial [Chryseosolibacter sp.]|nr:inorganic phosphate transporter [Chryseosolibacter sp.]
MFELDFSYTMVLILCLLAACGFEFVNGFHDTANAVATVIYTNSLKPWTAVILSGICNFLGVLIGGIGVAIGIVNLLPVESLVDQNISHSLSMVIALLLSAITWNLLTWYFGIPCSSSHTLIGSILGVGLAYSLLPGTGEAAVNWTKAYEIGLSLLISPLFGFTSTIVLMYLIRRLTRKQKYGETLFRTPKKNTPPPLVVRGILILTCSGVSLSHGSNDGQKGVGLVMLILIGIVPSYFALDRSVAPSSLAGPLSKIDSVVTSIDSTTLSVSDRQVLRSTNVTVHRLSQEISDKHAIASIPKGERFLLRKDIMILDRDLKHLMARSDVRISAGEVDAIKAELKSLRKITDYSPTWVSVMIAFSLGLGTMIGWKRIVRTIGEKIGKEHLNYAQGASAEIVAASTIGVSTYLGLPVSTTHVLSSGIAGSMVASKG